MASQSHPSGHVQANGQLTARSSPNNQIQFGQPSQHVTSNASIGQSQSLARRIFGNIFGSSLQARPTPSATNDHAQFREPSQHDDAQAVSQSGVEHGYAWVPTVRERNDNGTVSYRPMAPPTFVSNVQEQSIIPHGAENLAMTHGEVNLPEGTRLAAHLPLGPEDAPNAPGRSYRRDFRLMIEATNKIDTLAPDLEYARQHNWYQQIESLERQVHHWRRDINFRIERSKHSPIFQELLLTYPHIWKHVNSASLRQRLERRRLTAPIKAEQVGDEKDAVLNRVVSQVRARNPISNNSNAGKVDFFKKEEHEIQNRAQIKAAIQRAPRLPATSNHPSNATRLPKEEAGTRTRPATTATLGVSTPAEMNSPESDSDDCVIIGERKVNSRAHRRRRNGLEQSNMLSKGPRIDRSPSPYRERSPRRRRHLDYRERSPQRRAVIEELE
ncbi:hypothetical protein PFICI_02233 [Pestalotiopsis fici W106-1]|uniref:Uncharacterized protein n=1 Tax=Pestalotiopsis fici (strain W106-1 / CGMCC3.15140) TaxID=1229662 RepID=W3XDN8_PESFW|nr:uncharacterized protein PFICI_02233 [Pestalotiopsis fici W106-1]ETS84208.1 hypothetical protein PFICI_02233 [Pestalotiopsis fici W106-1]